MWNNSYNSSHYSTMLRIMQESQQQVHTHTKCQMIILTIIVFWQEHTLHVVNDQ